MKRKSIAMLAAALCTLAITVTALAAELINAEQARSIAAQWVPAGSTHLVTKDESFEFVPHYDVKFYDNKTNTAYEIEVLRNGGKVREFKMEAQTALGSHKIVLSVNDVQNISLGPTIKSACVRNVVSLPSLPSRTRSALRLPLTSGSIVSI